MRRMMRDARREEWEAVALEIGDDVRYEREEKLGEGYQGRVWRARDTLFEGWVAIKILKEEITSDPSLLARLLHEEAKLQAKLSSLQHPHCNIVYIVDVRQFDDGLGIVMEFVNGRDLRRLMEQADKSPGRKRKRPLPVSQVFDIALQVCEGLAVAHAAGIMHRDIKPLNILVRDDGVVKITDWGLAKTVGLAGVIGSFAGTPPYMSPEVRALRHRSPDQRRQSEGVDHRVDVYSLGVTLFELLTGEQPFNPYDDAEVERGVAERHQAMLAEKGVEPSLSAIIFRAMAARREDRYQTASALRQALHEWQDQHLFGDELEEVWKHYRDTRDAPEAERRFQALISRYPGNPRCYRDLGRFYRENSREDNAIEVLSRGIEAAPESAALWNARGRLYAKRGSPLAEHDLKRALALGLPERDARQVRDILERLRTPGR